MKHFRVIVLFNFILSACTNFHSSKLADIEHYGEFYYGYNMEEKGNYRLKHPKFIITKEGDSYKKISLIYQIPLEELLRANNETIKRKLAIGERVYFPQIIFHKVVYGEDLEMIADLYQISKKKIIRENNLVASQIQVGSFLKIPLLNNMKKTAHDSISNHVNLNSHSAENLPQEPGGVIADSAIEVSSKGAEFLWPLKGIVIKKFDNSQNNRYDGINIKAEISTPIKAAKDGKVIYLGSELKGFGMMIIIKHSDGWLSAYAHQNKFNVAKGDIVKAGDVIGYVGQTGDVDQPQLYFAIRKGLEPYDPVRYLPK